MMHTWKVAIDLTSTADSGSDDRITTAHARLTTDEGAHIEGFGRARRNPHDPDVTEIGEELAAARALRDVADRLLKATSDDLTALENRRVLLHH